jgi:uncharacterized delta-60 repeat protein
MVHILTRVFACSRVCGIIIALAFEPICFGASMGPLLTELPNTIERTIALPSPLFDYGTDVEQFVRLSNGGFVVARSHNVLVFTNGFQPNPAWSLSEMISAPVAVQADGKIIGRTRPATDPYTCLVRLKRDGSVDSTFNAPLILNSDAAGVEAVVVQPDGKILVGVHGKSSLFAGFSHGVFRLNSNGSPDSNFQVAQYLVARKLELLPDGRILVGCGNRIKITALGFETRAVIRLLTDGSLDTTFSAKIGDANYAQPPVAIAVQQDGKLLVSGYFSSTDGYPCPNIVRLQPNGARDYSFYPTAGGLGNAVKVQANGRIIVASTKLQRFFSDGRIDPSFSFQRGTYTNLLDVAFDESGRIYAAIGSVLFKINGDLRIVAPAQDTPQILEWSVGLRQPWFAAKTIPPGAAFEYADPNYPEFPFVAYRTREAP